LPCWGWRRTVELCTAEPTVTAALRTHAHRAEVPLWMKRTACCLALLTTKDMHATRTARVISRAIRGMADACVLPTPMPTTKSCGVLGHAQVYALRVELTSMVITRI
jgi:hypothetical protein